MSARDLTSKMQFEVVLTMEGINKPKKECSRQHAQVFYGYRYLQPTIYHHLVRTIMPGGIRLPGNLLDDPDISPEIGLIKRFR